MQNTQRKFRPLPLSLVVAGLMYGAAQPALASDLDIYRAAKDSKTTLVLMLDTSGSMGADQVGASACDLPVGVSSSGTSTSTSTTSPTFTQRFCRGSNGVNYFDRLTRLKQAIFQLMADPNIKDEVVMGLAQFSTQSNSSNASITADGRTGKIVVPAAPLTSTQRAAILAQVAAMRASNGTPTGHAYAEAAAYMMGTTTAETLTIRRDSYREYFSSGSWRYQTCNTLNNINYTTFTQTCKSWNSETTTRPSTATTGSYVSGSRTIYTVNVAAAGRSGFTNSVTASKSGSVYLSPLPTVADDEKECNGQGIYFLTDGEPNSSDMPLVLMRKALNDTSFNESGGLPSGTQSENAMPEVGAFAKRLFSGTNPAGVEIKTAVVGFGRVFEGIPTQTLMNPDTGKNRVYYNCTSSTNQDARNACNWGEKTHPSLPGVGGFGNGGFYYAASTQDIVDSIKNFVAELNKDIPAVPTGAIVVPQDTLAPETLEPFAYLPLLEPKPGTNTVVWPGNLKKYKVNNGTIFGRNSKPVFKNGLLSDETYDQWSVDLVADKAAIQKGGMFDRLPMPMSTNTANRNVFVENESGSTLTKVLPTKASVESTVVVGGLTTTANVNQKRRYLLNFMGYTLEENNDAIPSTLTRPDTPYRALGGIVHSTPVMMTYGVALDSDGALDNSKRDDHLLFGSLEGGLHIVNATTGEEQVVVVPRQILDKQPRALRQETTGSLDGTTPPNPTAYGVDAPWTAYAEYARKSNQIKAEFMYAYGGLRMGGDGFYGLDLTNKTDPQMLFSINSSKSGFSRLGQVWGKPVVTRVNIDGKPRLVVVVTGGYDMQYEDPKFNLASGEAKGNAVYMLDAKTGERLLTVGRSGADLNNTNMSHSIVGRVKVLDRDADGLTDHLYFADLGGQVFRVDLDNQQTTKANWARRVVRLADLSGATLETGVRPRFYEAPVVTIHDEQGQRFAVVNVASGDRSSPLYKANTSPNHVFGLIDRDVARVDLYAASVTLQSQNITFSSTDLIAKPATAAHQADMLSGAKKGWYYPLDAFGEFKQDLVAGLKAMNEAAAIRNDLYVPVYNPNVENSNSKCSAQVLGASEVYRYCLPFGICDLNDASNNRQRFTLGAGIQAVNFGAGTEGDSRRVLYQQTTGNIKDNDKPNATGVHREYVSPPRLQPVRWYDRQPKLPKTP
jgi:type IV pilus assembly protein PilY1